MPNVEIPKNSAIKKELFHPISRESREELIEAVMTAYENFLSLPKGNITCNLER